MEKNRGNIETTSEPWRNQKEGEKGFVRDQRFQSWERFASGKVHGG